MVTSDVNSTEFSGLEARLASTQLYDSNCRPVSLTPNSYGLKQMKKKVMIMKRRSPTSLNNSKDDRDYVSTFTTSDRISHTLKGKNLPDKERAYAEARARIFNSYQKKACSLSSPEGNVSLRGVLNIPSESLSFGSGKSPGSSGCMSTNEVCVLPSSSPIISTDDGINSQSVLVIQSSFFSEQNEASDESDDGSLNVKICNSSKSSNLPVAATVGAASKVTWRNRRQEESDPDFQRGTPLMVTRMPLSSMDFPTQLRYHPQNTNYQFQSTLLTGPPVLFHHTAGYLDYDNSNSTVLQGHLPNICSSQNCFHMEENSFPLRKNHSQMSFISNEQFRCRQPKRNLQCNISGKYDINKQSISGDMLMKYSSTAVSSPAAQSSSWSLWPSTSDNAKNNVTHLYPDKFPALG